MGKQLDNNEEEFDTVTLMLDDDKELECIVLAVFEVKDRQYIALLPEEDSEESDVYFYRYDEADGENPVLGNIDSEEEYEAVADAFDELLDDEEYEEAFGEDDEE